MKGCVIMANTNMAEEQNTDAQEVLSHLMVLKMCYFNVADRRRGANIMTNLNPDEVKSLGTAMYQVRI